MELEKPVATIITDDPIIEVLFEMQRSDGGQGILNMAKWIERYRPRCLPEGGFKDVMDLVPHDGTDTVRCPNNDGGGCTTDCGTCFGAGQVSRAITDNELSAEIAGRKCYDSFAEAGAKRTNSEYIRSMWMGRIPHRSTGYHSKITFFFAHISRRVSHELIRNYVGADRDEEGSPSQESTRFTHHPGSYIAHPYYLEDVNELALFKERAQRNYEDYCGTIKRKEAAYKQKTGQAAKGLDKKRIYESTSGDLLMSCGTSFIWSTNPMAMTKFFHERDDEAADMEMCRFARAWKRVALSRWPNLFPDFVPQASATASPPR